MRINTVAGNWKMNLDADSVSKWVSSMNKNSWDSTRVIVCPPYPFLVEMVKDSKGSELIIGAQNCSSEESGAFTGEVSPNMLKSIGVSIVIIGHSERRSIFGESNQLILNKIKRAIGAGLKVIFCCGENLDQRKDGTYKEFVKQQLVESLFLLDQEKLNQIIIAYEPIWAIGTGLTASPEQAQEMHAYIRQSLTDNYSENAGDHMTILYGGSVNPSNSAELFAKPDVDGGLVGGASLKVDSFMAIVNSI